MTPELGLLLGCARATITGDRAAATIPEPVDWQRFAALATRHGMAALARRALAGDPSLPPEAERSLADLARQIGGRSLSYSQTLLAILQDLREARITVMPLKGPVWAQELYGDLATRQFSDLDMLLHLEDVPRAEAVLAERGFIPAYEPDRRSSRPPMRGRHHLVLMEPGSGVIVELHWLLAGPKEGLRADAGEVLSRAGEVGFLGDTVLLPCPLDLFFYLAVHAASHRWSRIEHICALGAAATRLSGGEWTAVQAAASRYRVQRRVWVAVLLLERLGVTLPGAVREAAAADGIASEVASAAYIGWDEEDLRAAALRDAFAHARTMDGTVSAARRGLAYLLEPDEVDWSWVRLPRPLYPLYWALRPVRLGSAAARAASRRVLRRDAGA